MAYHLFVVMIGLVCNWFVTGLWVRLIRFDVGLFVVAIGLVLHWVVVVTGLVCDWLEVVIGLVCDRFVAVIDFWLWLINLSLLCGFVWLDL